MIDPLLGFIDDELLRKAMRYCAYSERCQQDVRQKMFELKSSLQNTETIIAYLIRENFINEERYAIAFAGGKFRISKWGKIKIRLALEQKNISAYCISKALKQIDNNDYKQTIKKLAAAQSRKIKPSNPLREKHLVSKALISKGFEPDLVWEVLKQFD